MEGLLIEIAKDSALAGFGIFVVWRMSVVMIVLAKSLTKVAEANAGTLEHAVDAQK